MKCRILFSGKNKKNISKCHLLMILPGVLSVKQVYFIILPVLVTEIAGLVANSVLIPHHSLWHLIWSTLFAQACLSEYLR